MSTATKLEYLNETKGLLKDSINSLGGNITSQTTFRQYATELDSIYSRLPKVSGTGSNISLTPTLKGRLGSVLKGNTLQDGTPSPSSPVEIQSATGRQEISVCGKNLFDKSSAITGKYYSSTGVLTDFTNSFCELINVNENTKYSLKIDNNYSSNVRLNIFVFDDTNQRLAQIRWGDTLASESSYTNQNYTMPSGAKYITISVLDMQPTTENIDKIPIQLEVGTEATTYEAYQSQEYEINFGKNLYNINNFSISSWDTGGGNYTSKVNDTLKTISDWTIYRSKCVEIPNLKKNTDYVLSGNLKSTNTNGGKVVIYGYNGSSTTQIKANDGTLSVGDFSLSFNTGNYTNIGISFNGVGGSEPKETIYENIQIEKGSQATSYSPYFTPIYLRKSKDGTYEDYITGSPNNWSIKRQIGSVVLDGSESSWLENSATKGLFQVTLSNVYFNNNTINAISNLLIGNTGTNIVQASNYTDNSIATFSGNRLFFRLNDYAENLVGFKTFLASNNIIANYVLATETTEPITNTELISQLNDFYNAKSYNGQTNISVDGDLPMILDVSAIIGDE